MRIELLQAQEHRLLSHLTCAVYVRDDPRSLPSPRDAG